jgi:alpha-1,2-mannosyltransferase
VSTSARWVAVTGTVFAVACVLRIGLVLASRGGPTGLFGYDPGVYYSAADALTYGRLPYRDFVLLHPPGLMLVGVPFALIGRLTTDETGLITANTVFALLGATNAALVVAVCRRAQLPLVAAALGGLFYAAWDGAAAAEVSFRLEPLGSAAFLCGVLALTSVRMPRRRALILAGVAFGFAACVKMWWIVPLAIVLGWHLRTRVRRESLPLAVGALATCIVIDGPFFAAAPRTMWRMIVTDQLGRPHIRTSPITRLERLTSLHSLLAGPPKATQAVALVAVLLVVGLLVVAAWRVTIFRLFVVISVAQVAVLLISPSYFSYYDDYLAATATLVVAAAAAGARAHSPLGRGGLVAAGLCVGLAGAATATVLISGTARVSARFPPLPLARTAATSGCVMADSPGALIELNVLSTDLARGCPNWVDVSGRTYDVDAPPPSRRVSRAANRKWQDDLRHYLLSGDAVITIRAATGYGTGTRRTLDRLPVLERAGPFVLRRVGRARAGY